LEVNIKVVDSAVKEVENSNKTLVDNMQQVCDVMEIMTGRIDKAEYTTKEMLSKYEESNKSAIAIERVVGSLMEELGVGGFMGVDDVKPGMKIAVALKSENGKKEYVGEVDHYTGKELFVSLEDKGQDILGAKQSLCQLRIVVENVLYCWDDIKISYAHNGEKGKYKLLVETNPKVFNRRKYPRMPIANSCTITRKDTDKTYRGKMVNVSANGFAFAAASDDFAELKGTQLVLDIPDFPVKEERTMEGVVIRSTDNHGEYIVGCRMPEDSPAIQKYVNDNYKE